MLGMNNMKIQIISMSLGVFIKLILNIILINNEVIGIYGAIISNVISYNSILIVQLWYLIYKEKIHLEFKNFIFKPLTLIMIMYFSSDSIIKIFKMETSIFEFLEFCLIEFVIYIFSVIVLKIIPKNVIKIAKIGRHNAENTEKTGKF